VTSAPSAIVVLLGLGAGAFASPTAYAAPELQPYSTVVLADFNTDGRVDVAANGATAPVLSVLLGNGDGSLAASVSMPVPGQPLPQGGPYVAAADLNGDGFPELLSVQTFTSTLAVLRNICGLTTSLGLDGSSGFASAPHKPT
jgi:hypothetical protein